MFGSGFSLKFRFIVICAVAVDPCGTMETVHSWSCSALSYWDGAEPSNMMSAPSRVSFMEDTCTVPRKPGSSRSSKCELTSSSNVAQARTSSVNSSVSTTPSHRPS